MILLCFSRFRFFVLPFTLCRHFLVADLLLEIFSAKQTNSEHSSTRAIDKLGIGGLSVEQLQIH